MGSVLDIFLMYSGHSALGSLMIFRISPAGTKFIFVLQQGSSTCHFSSYFNGFLSFLTLEIGEYRLKVDHERKCEG